MKKVTTAILITATMAGAVSCKKDLVGDGPVTTQTRTTQNFTGIDLRMNGNVYYTKGPVLKLEVTAKESIHYMLETSVSNERLIVRYSNGKTYDNDPSITINVTAPDISSFQSNTSGNIYCMNNIQQANLYVRNTGSGKIDLSRMTAQTAATHSEGSGDITVRVLDHLDVTIKGSGSVYFSGNPFISTHISGSGYLVRF
jgi:hypothetical protein